MGDEKVYHYKDGKIVGHSDKDDPYGSGKTYHYDADGKIIGHSDQDDPYGSGRTYHYDKDGRIIGHSEPSGSIYSTAEDDKTLRNWAIVYAIAGIIGYFSGGIIGVFVALWIIFMIMNLFE